jgi:hypothetical protein
LVAGFSFQLVYGPSRDKEFNRSLILRFRAEGKSTIPSMTFPATYTGYSDLTHHLHETHRQHCVHNTQLPFGPDPARLRRRRHCTRPGPWPDTAHSAHTASPTTLAYGFSADTLSSTWLPPRCVRRFWPDLFTRRIFFRRRITCTGPLDIVRYATTRLHEPPPTTLCTVWTLMVQYRHHSQAAQHCAVPGSLGLSRRLADASC